MVEASLEHGSLSSLRMTYVTPGDLMYLPYGSLVCEKALGAHNVALRASMTLISPAQTQTAQFLKAAAAPGTQSVGCNEFNWQKSKVLDFPDYVTFDYISTYRHIVNQFMNTVHC